MKFSKKTAHRLIVSLAMLAPVFYLFGVMFFYLNGAHNGLELASLEDSSSYSVHFENEQFYERAILTETYGEFGAHNEYASMYFEATSPFRLVPNDNHTSQYNRFLFGVYKDDGERVSLTTYVGPNITTFDYSGPYSKFGVEWYSIIDQSALITDYSFDLVYLDNNASMLNNSDYLFSQFFPHDNFVERMGSNALSANPIGFAPFGTFLSYLDVNVFHAANSQIALMLYGMVYWSLHVVIADLVYHVAVFIPNIIQRVFDWFGQKGLDDD